MKRALTPEERALWQYVTRNDAPLHPGHEPPVTPLPISPAAFPEIKRWRQGMYVPSAPACGQNIENQNIENRDVGKYAGIDRATAQRFRKGEYPFDGRLDLHGMSREKAHHALMAFVHRHYGRQSRCLLVITGKGQSKGQKNADKDGGVLRQLLPRWLAEPGVARMLLAIDIAQPQHGGGGAYYLLLRRQR